MSRIKATAREKAKKKLKQKQTRKAAYEGVTGCRIGPFISLLLSSHPVLCMISERKEAVDHTTRETFLILFQQ